MFSPHSEGGQRHTGPSLILLCYNRSKMKFIFQHCCEMKFHFGDNSRILR
ncbi:hypothetical protein [Klebsiella pneumoniae]|nr:hypothetical protein [Klebsiella pneumoniae]